MLLAANRRSTGVGVRPRGNRIEITADFTPDAALMVAAATFIIGVAREVMTWPSFELRALDGDGFPIVRTFTPEPHSSRKGWVARFSSLPGKSVRRRRERADVDDTRRRRLSLREMARRIDATTSGRRSSALGDAALAAAHRVGDARPSAVAARARRSAGCVRRRRPALPLGEPFPAHPAAALAIRARARPRRVGAARAHGRQLAPADRRARMDAHRLPARERRRAPRDVARRDARPSRRLGSHLESSHLAAARLPRRARHRAASRRGPSRRARRGGAPASSRERLRLTGRGASAGEEGRRAPGREARRCGARDATPALPGRGAPPKKEATAKPAKRKRRQREGPPKPPKPSPSRARGAPRATTTR